MITSGGGAVGAGPQAARMRETITNILTNRETCFLGIFILLSILHTDVDMDPMADNAINRIH
jgi:hypothetical protein